MFANIETVEMTYGRGCILDNQVKPVALVTGAGRGIGSVIAHELGMRGFDIALHYWDNEDDARRLAEEIQASGRRACLIKGDLTLPGVPAKVVDEAFEQLGRLDALINNAGLTISDHFLNFEECQLDLCYRLDFLAPYLCSQRAANRMVQDGIQGSIVNITSVHYERSTQRDSMYGSMKAALTRLTESMAYELGPHGIRVNAVAPGRILTSDQPLNDFDHAVSQVIPVGRSGKSIDIARAVAWLVSDEASFVTGATLRVDGGMNLPMNRALFNNELRFF